MTAPTATSVYFDDRRSVLRWMLVGGTPNRACHHELRGLTRTGTETPAEVRAEAKRVVASLGWTPPARWVKVKSSIGAGWSLRGTA